VPDRRSDLFEACEKLYEFQTSSDILIHESTTSESSVLSPGTADDVSASAKCRVRLVI